MRTGGEALRAGAALVDMTSPAGTYVSDSDRGRLPAVEATMLRGRTL